MSLLLMLTPHCILSITLTDVFFQEYQKNNQLLQFKTLISITAVDYPKNKDRFEVNYFLLSYKLKIKSYKLGGLVICPKARRLTKIQLQINYWCQFVLFVGFVSR